MLAVRQALILKNIPKLGDSKLYNFIRSLGNNLADLFTYNKSELISLGLTEIQTEAILKPDWKHIEHQISETQKNSAEIITIFDSDYPEILKQIYDPPLVLHVKGNKKILSAELFGIVGTRKPTIYGKQMAHNFSEEILANGYIVTSGFAKGIDIIAHLAAVQKQQPTVAVFGTSLDYIYPAEHKKYIDKIIDCGGVIISEAAFTTPPNPGCFPRRNRIISGISKGILVVEAARKSGSLITARCALEQGREVFAIPGNITNQQALGCLDLISAGAKLTKDVSDIMEELCGIRVNYGSQVKKSRNNGHGKKFPAISTPDSPHMARSAESSSQHLTTGDLFDGILQNRHPNLNSVQKDLLTALSGGQVTFDSIVETCNLSAEEVSSQLLQLEVMGLINSSASGYIKL